MEDGRELRTLRTLKIVRVDETHLHESVTVVHRAQGEDEGSAKGSNSLARGSIKVFRSSNGPPSYIPTTDDADVGIPKGY